MDPIGYIGCAASPTSVTRPLPQNGSGSRSIIGYSRTSGSRPSARTRPPRPSSTPGNAAARRPDPRPVPVRRLRGGGVDPHLGDPVDQDTSALATRRRDRIDDELRRPVDAGPHHGLRPARNASPSTQPRHILTPLQRAAPSSGCSCARTVEFSPSAPMTMSDSKSPCPRRPCRPAGSVPCHRPAAARRARLTSARCPARAGRAPPPASIVCNSPRCTEYCGQLYPAPHPRASDQIRFPNLSITITSAVGTAIRASSGPRPELDQLARRVRQQVDADAQRPQLGHAVDDLYIGAHTGRVQAQSRAEPAYPGADDQYPHNRSLPRPPRSFFHHLLHYEISPLSGCRGRRTGVADGLTARPALRGARTRVQKVISLC